MLASSHLLALLLVGGLAPTATDGATSAPETSASTTSASTTGASTTSASSAGGEAEVVTMTAPTSTTGFSSSGPAPAEATAQGEGSSGPPPEYGPFYEPEAPSDTWAPSDPPRTKPPLLSLKGGAFCFIEDAACRSALIVSADVGVGFNGVAGDRGVDVPLTQWSARGGFTLRPVTLLKKRWHPWSVGVVGGFVRSSGAIASTSSTVGSSNPDLLDVSYTNGARFGLLNQVWLSEKRHALHLDFTLGVVRSTVLTSEERYFGTHVDVALGVGGWGALFLAGDFLDKDARIAFGFRGHGVVAGPVAAMVLLGLLAGGAL
ncbi:MAG: hypothetical protein R3A79_23295 [Nannocystaceae bacterium]